MERMKTAEKCNVYAAEYQAPGIARNISTRRATALMCISRSLVSLANQLDRLREIENEEKQAEATHGG